MGIEVINHCLTSESIKETAHGCQKDPLVFYNNWDKNKIGRGSYYREDFLLVSGQVIKYNEIMK